MKEDMILSITKYMTSEQILKLINQDKINTDCIVYLLYIHYPWISENIDNEDPYYLYEQAYLATMNKANSPVQKIYNDYLRSIIGSRLGDLITISDPERYERLYSWIRARPSEIENILIGNIDYRFYMKLLYSDIEGNPNEE